MLRSGAKARDATFPRGGAAREELAFKVRQAKGPGRDEHVVILLPDAMRRLLAGSAAGVAISATAADMALALGIAEERQWHARNGKAVAVLECCQHRLQPGSQHRRER